MVEKAGLQSAADLKEFNRKQQEVQNKKLMEQIMREGGAQAKTVYRNKEGAIVDMKALSEKDRLRIDNEQ